MTQLPIDFSRKPSAAELNLSVGSHSFHIYRWLLGRPITNAEIVREIGCFNSTGRISDLRAKLRPFLPDYHLSRNPPKGRKNHKPLRASSSSETEALSGSRKA